MRKSFIGQRPPKGKSHGGKRGGRPGAGGSRQASKGGHETREGRGAKSGTPFRERPAGGGSRDERAGKQGSRGGERGSASRIRFQKRAAHSGARVEREGASGAEAGGRKTPYGTGSKFRQRYVGGGGARDERESGRGADAGGRKTPYGTGSQFRQRSAGGVSRGGRSDRQGERGGRDAASRDAGSGNFGSKGSKFRFQKRGARGGAQGERKDRTGTYAGRGDPPPGVRVRERQASAGSRYDRMDRPEWRERQQSDRARPRGAGGKHSRANVSSVTEPMRIAKAMARAGLCSRREAERWIADGRVSINGQVLKSPGVEVKPKDRVLVDGRPLPVAEPSQLWRYNKPKGLVTTHDDPQGRPTVFDNLPPGLPRVISVGRLDFNTEGLILLTNDGELARHLELPATGWLRRYRVRAKGRVTQADLDGIKEGVEIEGVRYGPVDGVIDSVQGANIWLTIGIREGKNREVRKVLTHLGLEVNRLIRISFGPFQLMDLEPGQAESIKRRVLADQLGPQLAAEFGLVEPPEEKPGKKGGGGQRRPGKPDGSTTKDRREDA